MPVYDFVCRECNRRFQVTLPIERYDAKKIKCPKCESKRVERIWSNVFVETAKKS